MPAAFPPRVVRGREDIKYLPCCGGCALKAADIRLYYFKDQKAIDDCSARGGQLPTSLEGLNLTASATQAITLPPHVSVAVVKGHTLTSPSFYLEFLGTVRVVDWCGQIGAASTSPFIAVAPQHLSTVYIGNYTMGQEVSFEKAGMFRDGGGTTSRRLDIADIECPTFGVGRSTAADGKMHYIIGHPWLPMILRPVEVLSFDLVSSASCQWIPDGWWNAQAAALFDPPRSLEPGEGLVPDPTQPTVADTTPVDPPSGDPPAQPAQPVTTELPVQTGGPGGLSIGNPGQSPDPKGVSEADPKDGQQDPAGSIQDPQKSTNIDDPNDNNHGDPSGEEHSSHTGPGAHKRPDDAASSNGNPEVGPETHGDETIETANLEPVLTAGDQTFTANPTRFSIAGTTIRPGDPPVTISGTEIALDPSGVLVVGSQTFSLSPTSPTVSGHPVVVAGRTITPDARGFTLHGLTVLPSGSAVVVDGTSVGLVSNGVVDVGGSVTTLPNPYEYGLSSTGVFSSSAGGAAESSGGVPAKYDTFEGKAIALGTNPVRLIAMVGAWVLFIFTGS
ncbi:uncharacterized protein KY384_001220 [Bacidia gigantensis]|uniref:uncharacterized protein n=1 Tax=Bacidia gigantensis TaxID=2732470 RepID=UPI001D03B4E1|nr:uncharacterized protein KY384_001220 [Bacidia gigantensis]KAG8534375.1 hypothetical protein KY384_001220 [Bacidia gigantensis]